MANALITQLNNPLIMQRINQRLAAVVALILVIACAYVLVEITWLFFPEDESVVPVAVAPRPLASNQNQQVYFRNLTAANLFGVSQQKTVVKQTVAPETKLNLTLKGVLAATPMERASAIIARGKSGKEDIFSVGDKMPGGVIIREIHADHVVLERNGRLETLKLQKDSGLAVGGVGGNALTRRAASPASALKQIRSNILKNPTSFGEYALPVVVKENGKQIGYRLQPQSKGQLLSELGIQANDVITKINGVTLDKPQNGISALRKLSTASNLNIVVRRNGAEIPLNISLR